MEDPTVKNRDHALPDDVRLYLEPSYWDGRFAQEKHYEWFKEYSQFRHLVLQHVNKSGRVLELGCGNSTMGEEMYGDGFTQMTCTDLSEVAIEHKKKRCIARGYDGIKLGVADVTNLPFEDCSFDVIIEKGVMDVLFVDSGDPWDPKLEAKKKVFAMLHEAHRVLTRNGIFISITFGQPHFRRPFFEARQFTWSMEYFTFGDLFHYFFYSLRKGKAHDSREVPSMSKDATQMDLVQEQMDDDNYLLTTMLDD